MDSFIKSAFIKILMPCIVIRIRTQDGCSHGAFPPWHKKGRIQTGLQEIRAFGKKGCKEMIDLSSQSLFYRIFLFNSSSVSMKLEAKCFINQSTSSI